MKIFSWVHSKVKKEKFLLSSTLLFVASLISNLTAYFYQFAMSRLMNENDFGTLNSLLSLFALVTVPTGVIGLVVTRYISQFQTQNQPSKLKLFIINSFRNLFFFGALLGFLLLIVQQAIQNFFHLENSKLILILAIMTLTAFVSPIGISLLQGLQLFYRFGAFLISTGLIRLITGIILVYLHWGIEGALVANIVSFAGGILLLYSPLKKILSVKKTQTIEKHTREILTFSIPVTLVFIGTTCFVHLDLILVKHFLPDLAGQYAAAAILGRSIFYFPGALAMTMYPMITEFSILKRNTFPILKRCLFMTLILSSVGLATFIMFPDFLIHMLFGSQYPYAKELLPFYSTAMLPLALSSVLIQHELALRKFKFTYMLLGMVILEGTLILFFHAHLRSILMILNFCQWSLFIVLAFVVLRNSKISISPDLSLRRSA